MLDVAELAGVSLKTVSRVVNGEAGVSEHLSARVGDAVQSLRYRPDPAASSLRRLSGRTQTIAVVVDDLANPFSAAVLRGVEDAALARNVLVLAASSDEDFAREREAIDSFVDRRVDGIVLMAAAGDHSYLRAAHAVPASQKADAAPVPSPQETPLSQHRPTHRTPLVAVDRPVDDLDVDAVLVDNHGAAAAATRHLLAGGHERIAFLGDALRIFTAQARRDGFLDAMREAGIEPPSDHVLADLRDGEAAREALTRLLQGGQPPTAVLAARNTAAVGAIHALRDRDLHRSIALVSFDDVELGDLLEPGITAIVQAPDEIGRRAAELLFARIDGQSGPAARHIVPTRLVRRGSGELPRLRSAVGVRVAASPARLTDAGGA